MLKEKATTAANESIIEQLSISLIEDDTSVNRKKWAHYIIFNKINLMDLVDLLYYKKPVNLRFTWLIGDICELNPTAIFPAITYLFTKRNEIRVLNFNRSLAKMFWLAGVPDEIEGEVIDEMFKWLLDLRMDVSIKNYSLLALYNLTSKHIDIKNELITVIEDQLNKNTSSFEKRAKKILDKLKNTT